MLAARWIIAFIGDLSVCACVHMRACVRVCVFMRVWNQACLCVRKYVCGIQND